VRDINYMLPIFNLFCGACARETSPRAMTYLWSVWLNCGGIWTTFMSYLKITRTPSGISVATRIPTELVRALKPLPGFRNVLVREYVLLDMQRVVEASTKSLEDFLQIVETSKQKRDVSSPSPSGRGHIEKQPALRQPHRGSSTISRAPVTRITRTRIVIRVIRSYQSCRLVGSRLVSNTPADLLRPVVLLFACSGRRIYGSVSKLGKCENEYGAAADVKPMTALRFSADSMISENRAIRRSCFCRPAHTAYENTLPQSREYQHRR
jgi:hypothetical protein